MHNMNMTLLKQGDLYRGAPMFGFYSSADIIAWKYGPEDGYKPPTIVGKLWFLIVLDTFETPDVFRFAQVLTPKGVFWVENNEEWNHA